MESKKCLKYLWITIIFVAFILFLIHFTNLVILYMEEGTSVSVSENVLQFELPDIYVCNARPLSSSRILDAKLNKEKQEINQQIAMLTNYIEKNITNPNKDAYFSLYWATLDHSVLRQAYGFSYEEKNYEEADIILTKDTEKMEWPGLFISNDQHFVCEYSNLTNANSTNHFLKVVSVYYSDSYHLNKSNISLYGEKKLEELDYRYFPDRILGRQGYRIYFTEKNVYPHEGTPFVTVNPGESTSIFISMSKYTAVNTKAKPCREEDTYVYYVNKILPDDDEEEDFTNQYKKTQTDCRLHKTLQYLLSNEECACIPYWFPVEGREYKRYPTCANLTYLIENSLQDKILTKMDCGGLALDYLNNMSPTECAEDRPCVRYIYTPWTSINKMDPTAYHARFYKEYEPHKGDWGQNLFYKEVQTFADSDKKADFANHNWVEVIIQPHHYFCSETVETITYTLVNLLSDFGGIVGLYLGASLVTFAELFSLAYDWLIAWKNKKKNETINQTDLRRDLNEDQIIL